MPGSAGLRELKKARTRQHIVETAARLFADRGFEQVTVSDVARAAEVPPRPSTTTSPPRTISSPTAMGSSNGASPS